VRILRAAAPLLLALLMAAAPAAAAPSQQEVEEALTCQCGCGLTVHACNHLNCGSGEPMKKEIADRLARGEGKDQILAAFTTRYGEKVLSAPTFRGFNWFAWLTPFAAVLAAGAGLVVVIRRRVRTTAALEALPTVAPTGDTTALRARLARELEQLDRE
jgi:cytochrome c-type biogenesis protein CcmH/NrfF